MGAGGVAEDVAEDVDEALVEDRPQRWATVVAGMSSAGMRSAW